MIPYSKHAKPEINDQQELYIRLQILRGKIEKILQAKFHLTFPCNPTALYAEFLRIKGSIVRLKKKKLIREDQYQKLFPTSGLVFHLIPPY